MESMSLEGKGQCLTLLAESMLHRRIFLGSAGCQAGLLIGQDPACLHVANYGHWQRM